MHNGILTRYIYDGNDLIVEQRCAKRLTYFYCVDGVAGFRYNNETYLYRKNVQGDVTHIYKQEEDTTLTLVAHYSYDAWGNYDILQDKEGIATLNPFRYRSYYFDEETGLYYLQSRYYDPELGRFISADSIEYLDPETLGGINLYAYCGNNPIMHTDSLGSDWNSFWQGVGNWFVKAGHWINNNIIQPTVTFFKENWDVILGAGLLLASVVLAVCTFGAATCIAGVVCGMVIGGLVGGLNALATGGNIAQGIFTGMLIGTLGAISAPAAGLAAAGMSLLNDRMNGKKAGWDSVGRAAFAGLTATAFAQIGGVFNEAVFLTEGFKLMNGVIWGVSAATVGSTAFFSALFFTFLNWGHDLTVGAIWGK